MKRIVSLIIILAAVLAGIVIAQYFFISRQTPARSPFRGYTGEVMLYTSMQEKQILAVKKGFEEKYPNIEMKYYFSGSGSIKTKLSTERHSGQPQADVLWLGDPIDYITLKEERLLMPYISPQGIRISRNYIDSEHYFTGARFMRLGIVYNTDLISKEQAPKNWEELTDSKWLERIVMADPANSGTMRYFVGAFLSDPNYGEDFFSRLGKNNCAIEGSTFAAHMQVAKGIRSIGIGVDYVVESLEKQGAPVDFIYPEDGFVAVFSPVALLEGCRNEQNAKLLYDFILSKEGQQILVENGMRSVRSDILQTDDPEEVKSLLADEQWIYEHDDEIIEMFDTAMGLK